MHAIGTLILLLTSSLFTSLEEPAPYIGVPL